MASMVKMDKKNSNNPLDWIKEFKNIFDCSSDEKLAHYLGTCRAVITRAKIGIISDNVRVPYHMLYILLKSMPEKQLKKCLLKMHKLIHINNNAS